MWLVRRWAWKWNGRGLGRLSKDDNESWNSHHEQWERLYSPFLPACEYSNADSQELVWSPTLQTCPWRLAKPRYIQGLHLRNTSGLVFELAYWSAPSSKLTLTTFFTLLLLPLVLNSDMGLNVAMMADSTSRWFVFVTLVLDPLCLISWRKQGGGSSRNFWPPRGNAGWRWSVPLEIVRISSLEHVLMGVLFSGYPAYLGTRLAFFYERAGMCHAYGTPRFPCITRNLLSETNEPVLSDILS